MIAKRVSSVFRAQGLTGVLNAVGRRLWTPWARSFRQCRPIVSGAAGIEIGGPSPIFSRGGLIPVYPLAGRVDNVNFASRTIWEGEIEDGDSFDFHAGKAPGKQFIAEGADLRAIPSGKYDFLLSSHMLEHSANVLRALSEWRRVLKPGGALILVVPHRDATFNHRRPLTTMQHLLEDFEKGIGEGDLTHVTEVLQLHDGSRDSGEHGMSLRERAERNPELRSIHHHVFDTRLVINAVAHSGLEVLAVEPLRPYHVFVVARNPAEGVAPKPFSSNALRAVLQKSPFPTDRQNP